MNHKTARMKITVLATLLSLVSTLALAQEPGYGVMKINDDEESKSWSGTASATAGPGFVTTDEDVVLSTEDEDETRPPVSVSAYPNPTRDIVTISVQAEEDEKATMGIGNIYGRKKKRRAQSSSVVYQGGNKATIDMSGYAPGVYFVEIKVGDRVFIQRIMVL